MPPRQGKEDVVDATLKRVRDAFLTEDVSPEFSGLVSKKIARLRAPPVISTMAAKEFSLKDAVLAFGLKFTDRVPNQAGSPRWCVEDIPESKDFVCSPSLGKSFKCSRSTVDPYLMGWLA